MVSNFEEIQGFQWVCMAECSRSRVQETNWQSERDSKKNLRNFVFPWWSQPQITLKNSDIFESCSHPCLLSHNVSALSVGFTVFELSASKSSSHLLHSLQCKSGRGFSKLHPFLTRSYYMLCMIFFFNFFLLIFLFLTYNISDSTNTIHIYTFPSIKGTSISSSQTMCCG